jgi:acyl-CoA synthetase (AMP-forming)/AMP-acid ligase II
VFLWPTDHRPALVADDAVISHAELAARVESFDLGGVRRLVALQLDTTVDAVVAFLACLRQGHPVLLTPEEGLDRLVATYDPDVVITAGVVEARRGGSVHDLHPDLAVLMSTSGTTGAPKLVRLSLENLHSNATAIASYLGLSDADVAITSLPLHYVYGLSVLTSHLAAGASVVLTEASVVDEHFWAAARTHGATGIAGVPHTFDLLDRVGLPSIPTLRYLTQAGGRMAPEKITHYAARVPEFYVMYGQTEATARMAYVPPALLPGAADAIGVPIPGGSFRIEPLPERPASVDGDPEVGELVYAGPNVMLGYAECAADLALGRTITELRTGDIGRQREDGLFELVGRRSGFAKVFGLRIDLAHLERSLADGGVMAHCIDDGTAVLVAVDASARPVDAARVTDLAVAAGVPAQAVDVVVLNGIPRLPNGKPDLRSIRSRRPQQEASKVPDLFARILRKPVKPSDTFVSLGGDSLSYVELSLRLENTLGHLPAGWQQMTIEELASAKQDRRRLARVEANVVMRAAAIVAIVGSHSNLFTLLGGAHVLIALAGFNFARFHLTDVARRTRVRHLAGSIVRILVPSVLWLAFAATASEKYTWKNVVLLNGILGTREWSEGWHYWFIEMLVGILIFMAAAFAVPLVDRVERRSPFWLPFALSGAFLLTRYGIVDPVGGDEIHRAHVVFWLFALGWAIAKSTTLRHRFLTSAMVVATVPGFFETTARGVVVIVGVLVLIWFRTIPVPRRLVTMVGTLASASLHIYLCHWQIYPYLEFRFPLLATLLSLSAGTAFWWVAARVESGMRENRRWLSPLGQPVAEEQSEFENAVPAVRRA